MTGTIKLVVTEVVLEEVTVPVAGSRQLAAPEQRKHTRAPLKTQSALFCLSWTFRCLTDFRLGDVKHEEARKA